MKFIQNFYFLLFIALTSCAMQAPNPPIITAARNGDYPMLQNLLDYGVDVNTIDQKHKANALFWAIDFGHIDIAYNLIRSTSVNINARNIYGSTALLLARVKHAERIVDELLNRSDIDVTAANNNGRTFFDFEIINTDTTTEKIREVLHKANAEFFEEHGPRLAELAKAKGFDLIAKEIERKLKIKLV